MIKFIKKNRTYIYTFLISLIILITIFLIKGIYPFGCNSLIYSDMNDQITSYFYYFYDSIKGSNSLLMNFSSSSGINFFGIIAYYLLSPFSLLILFIERSNIHLFISIIIALKIITCNITCHYLIKKLFKNINSLLSVFLSLLYGFSIYSINYYQITGWIDVMYMLPLVVIGLKNLFDTDNPKLYVVALTLSLYFNFYISIMVIIFILLLSFFYTRIYVPNEEKSKKILSLGINTILSIGMSLLIVIPTYKQISISSRMITDIEKIINSGIGPLTDKVALLLFGPILFVGLILLVKEYKKHKKFLSFYIPCMILLLIPILIEPTNKLLHFGSYASFSYRFGFITTLFMIIGAGYYFNNVKVKEEKQKNIKKYISIFLSAISSIIILILTRLKYNEFQLAIDNLTLSKNKITALILLIMFMIIFITILFIIILNKGLNRLSYYSIMLLTLVHIFCTSYIYVGIEHVQKNIILNYHTLNQIEKDSKNDEYYRYKNETNSLINNSSNVTTIPSLDHFSSLTDNSNQKILKKLGYNSYWTQTFSKGGTSFSDVLLANKYLLTKESEVNGYILERQYNDLYLFKYDKDISYGYLINKNVSINKHNNTFDIQNDIYKSITNDDHLFEVEEYKNVENITIKDNNYFVEKNNYVEWDININDKKEVYLELYSSLYNSINDDIYEQFNIYLNDNLYLKNYPTKDNNGLVNLGIFENQKITIKVEFLSDCYLESLNIGLLDIGKLDNFITNYKLDYDIKFNGNKIEINIDSKNDNKILFLPINYNKGYIGYNNGKKVDIQMIYDNYIGIKLNKGNNDITITFIPTGLNEGIIISLVFFIVALIVLNPKVYITILEINQLKTVANLTYNILYIISILILYLLPTMLFIISYLTYIKL